MNYVSTTVTLLDAYGAAITDPSNAEDRLEEADLPTVCGRVRIQRMNDEVWRVGIDLPDEPCTADEATAIGNAILAAAHEARRREVDQITMDLASRIRGTMAEQGVSVAEAARRIGRPASTLRAQLSRRPGSLRPAEVHKLAIALSADDEEVKARLLQWFDPAPAAFMIAARENVLHDHPESFRSYGRNVA